VHSGLQAWHDWQQNPERNGAPHLPLAACSTQEYASRGATSEQEKAGTPALKRTSSAAARATAMKTKLEVMVTQKTNLRCDTKQRRHR
jgi:hypothetical protein